MKSWLNERSYGRHDTGIHCPRCGDGTLQVRASCLQSYCLCPACHRRFLLADLAPILSDAQFEVLAEAVESHLSNRV